MGKINLGRVLMGGLLAGLIINIGEFIFNGLLFVEEMNAAMAALNKPPVDASMIVWFVVFGFGLGCMMVWVYAAIRPRFGAGVQTAICAALTVWGLAYLYPTLGFVILNLFPRRMMVIGTIWGLFELAIAGVAGAWLYSETPSTVRT
jgi:pimeloyl-ACP methyl ester carboxylesterase